MLAPHEVVQKNTYDSYARRWNFDAYYWMYKEKRERQVKKALELLAERLPGRLDRVGQWGGATASSASR